MASVGILLKKEREKKKISLDELTHNTKIGKKYLKALESDNYTIFPGETYVIGFMRNYARALGLDTAEIINKYKSDKIGSEIQLKASEKIEEPKVIESKKKESEAISSLLSKKEKKKEEKGGVEVIELPDEDEIEKDKKNVQSHKVKRDFKVFKMPLKEKKLINIAHYIIGGGIVVGAVILFFVIKFIVTSLSKGDSNKIYTNYNEIKLLEFSGNILQSDFTSNEYYKINLGGKTYNILFEKLTELSDVNNSDKEKVMEFAFHLNDLTIPLKLKEAKEFDFDYDTKNDLKVKVMSVNDDLINARIEKLHAFIVIRSNQINQVSGNSTNTNRRLKSKANGSSEGVSKGKIILEAIVREKTYIKAFIDGKEQEGIIYYPRDKVKLEANDSMQLKIGNAGGIVAKINGKPQKLGKRGEIANKVITWQRDPYDDSVYNLVIKDWQ